jgi:hypothetical protein
MMVHKKHTSCDNLSQRNLFHSGTMHMPLACINIDLLLIIVLLGIGALSCLMTSLVAIEIQLVVRWNS